MSDTSETRAGLHTIRALCRGGTRWRAHGLESEADGSHVFRALSGYGALLGIVRAVGFAAIALGVFAVIETGKFALLAFCAVVGAIFLGTAALIRPAMAQGARIIPSARVIELPDGFLDRGMRRIRLEEIAAIQYVPYRVHGTEPLRVIHGEIDLLLRNGQRLNVVNHNELDRLRRDAATLSRLVGVPLHEHPVYEGIKSRQRPDSVAGWRS